MELSIPLILLLIYALFNLFTFCAYWKDKRAAIKGEWRISEGTLLGLALIGGSLGAVAAQHLLRHKTRKEPFRSLLMAIVALHILLASVRLFAPAFFSATMNVMLGRH